MKPIHRINFSLLLFICTAHVQFSFATIDIGVTEIIHPEEIIYDAGFEYIEIVVENFGSESISEFSALFFMDGSSIISEMITSELAPGDTMHYTFETMVDLSALGSHALCAYTFFIFDSDFGNDTFCKEIVCVEKIVDIGDEEVAACISYLLDAGNEGATFLWSTGEVTQTILVTESGIYWVQVTPPGFDVYDIDSIIVEIIPLPETNFSYTVIDGITYFENNCLNSTSYIWDFGDGTISYEENPVHTFASQGNYLVTLSSSNDCGTNINSGVVSTSTQMNPIDQLTNKIQIYPNPSAQFLVIENISFYQSIKIFSSIGENMKYRSYENGIDVSNLLPGKYYLKCDWQIAQFVVE